MSGESVRVAAFVPGAPLVVDGLTGGRVEEVERLRAACRAALSDLLAGGPTSVTIVGTGTGAHPVRWPAGHWQAPARACLAGFGAAGPRTAATDQSPDPAPDAMLALPFAVGALALAGAGYDGDLELLAADPRAAASECTGQGRALAERGPLLVVADLSNRRGAKPPGGAHPAAGAQDDLFTRALSRGDAATLAGVDVDLAGTVGIRSRPAWQVLAGWVGDDVVRARLWYQGAPYGVGYVAGTWTVR